MKIKLTTSTDRMQADWQKLTGDSTLKVEQIGDSYYAFGTELSTLKLYKRYSEAFSQRVDGLALLGNIKADYSENRKTHFFRLQSTD